MSPPANLPPCPHLPTPRPAMDWRNFHGHGEARGPAFYGTALEYGHYLWRHGRVARAILCLDRAMGAEVGADDPVVHAWPMPYGAMAWFLAQVPDGIFIGNPRVHFQHYADRMNEPRRTLRQARAWACWALTRRIRPDLPSDPRHAVIEPTVAEIAAALTRDGLPGEVAEWQRLIEVCGDRYAP